jgi:chromosomal replication initiator protein
MILIRDIIAVVADVFAVDPADVTGSCRRPEFVKPRHVAMYLAREAGERSLPEIGRAFNRDHTSVLYAIGRVADSRDPELLYLLAQAAARLEARHFSITINREAA